MSKHTNGPLHVGLHAPTIVYAQDGWAVCDAKVFHVHHGGPEVAEANARRIVACWNALHGIQTEALELAPNIEAVWNDLIAERDKLRAALEMARNGLAWYQDTYPGAASGCDDEAMAEIDAALAGHNPDNLG